MRPMKAVDTAGIRNNITLHQNKAVIYVSGGAVVAGSPRSATIATPQ